MGFGVIGGRRIRRGRLSTSAATATRVVLSGFCAVLAVTGPVEAVTVPPISPTASVPSVSAYVGGYGSDGLAITSWPTTGTPTTGTPNTRMVLDVSSPTFVRSHPKLPVVYVTSELGPDKRNLRSVTSTGTVLSAVNSGGTAPVRSDVNATGDRLAVANYDGSVALFSLTRTGAIGGRLALVSLGTGSGSRVAPAPNQPAGSRSTSPSASPSSSPLSHPHSVTFNAAGTELWVADIGTDLVTRFDLGPKRSTLTEAERIPMTSGSGPRQVLFGAGGVVYVASELDGHIDVFVRGPSATRLVRRIGIRPDAKTAEITLHPSGRWLVALSRGTGECVLYQVRGDTLAESSAASCGNWPRFATFDRSGSILMVAAQRGDQLLEFSFDTKIGALTKVGTLNFSKPAVVVPVALK